MTAAKNSHDNVPGLSANQFTRLNHLSAMPKILLRLKDELKINKDQIRELKKILHEFEILNLQETAGFAAAEFRIQHEIYEDQVETDLIEENTEELAVRFKAVVKNILAVNLKAKAVLHQEQLDKFNELSLAHQYGGQHHHPHG